MRTERYHIQHLPDKHHSFNNSYCYIAYCSTGQQWCAWPALKDNFLVLGLEGQVSPCSYHGHRVGFQCIEAQNGPIMYDLHVLKRHSCIIRTGWSKLGSISTYPIHMAVCQHCKTKPQKSDLHAGAVLAPAPLGSWGTNGGQESLKIFCRLYVQIYWCPCSRF